MENQTSTNWTCAKCYDLFKKGDPLYVVERAKQSDLAYHIHCIPTDTDLENISSRTYEYEEKGVSHQAIELKKASS